MTKALMLLCFIPVASFGQITIIGKVFSREDSRPVANVNVFLDNTTIGAQTTPTGVYTLTNIKPGKYDVTVSIVGFSSQTQRITVGNIDITLPDIYLAPKVLVLNEVKIVYKDDSDWQRNLELFKDNFLGTSDLAKECQLINPELLDLNCDKKTGILNAKSADFLIIENRALGYRLKYLLSNFSYDHNANQFFYGGSVLFEEMKGTVLQVDKWNEKRKEVYSNSVTHFLRAGLSHRLSQGRLSCPALPDKSETAGRQYYPPKDQVVHVTKRQT